jgi:hypothetical protein
MEVPQPVENQPPGVNDWPIGAFVYVSIFIVTVHSFHSWLFPAGCTFRLKRSPTVSHQQLAMDITINNYHHHCTLVPIDKLFSHVERSESVADEL